VPDTVTWANAAHVAVVEVDRDTGETENHRLKGGGFLPV